MPTSFSLERTLLLPAQQLLVRLTVQDAWPADAAIAVAGDPGLAPTAAAPLTITAQLPLDTERLPSAAVRFLPAEPRIDQIWRFSSLSGGALAATVPGAPAEMAAEIQFAEITDGTLVRADITVSCSVPLFGGVVEQAMKPVIEEQVDKQFARL